MSVVSFSKRKMIATVEPVQEVIGRLQDEVRWLQTELARTRRALEQREVLLRNSQLRERELRSEVGVR